MKDPDARSRRVHWEVSPPAAAPTLDEHRKGGGLSGARLRDMAGARERAECVAASAPG